MKCGKAVAGLFEGVAFLHVSSMCVVFCFCFSPKNPEDTCSVGTICKGLFFRSQM